MVRWLLCGLIVCWAGIADAGNLVNSYRFVSLAPPGAFLYDTFTDTGTVGIASHTPEIGGAWTAGLATPSIASGNLYITTNALISINKNDATPPSADYSVTTAIKHFSSGGSYYGGPMIRTQADGSGYGCFIVSDGTVVLSRRGAAGVYASLIGGASPSISGFAAETYYTTTLSANGSTISCVVDGTNVSISGTDNTISTAGVAGLVLYGGFHAYINSVTAQ